LQNKTIIAQQKPKEKTRKNKREADYFTKMSKKQGLYEILLKQTEG
jgi:hypothetical protein